MTNRARRFSHALAPDGFAIQSACCRKRGSQCIGGYVQGKDSTCSNTCKVGLARIQEWCSGCRGLHDSAGHDETWPRPKRRDHGTRYRKAETALAIADYARTPRLVELSTSFQVTGRLIAAPKGLEAFPLTEFRVILLTPAGIGAEAMTDEQGRFELIVRAARAVLAKHLTLQTVSLGDLLFDPMLDSPEGQNFYLLAMLLRTEAM